MMSHLPFHRVPESIQILAALLAALAITWGFGYFVYDLSPGFLAGPSLIISVFMVPLTILAEWGRRRARQRELDLIGKCPTCAYDLRAHKPGEKCPECGTPIPAKP